MKIAMNIKDSHLGKDLKPKVKEKTPLSPEEKKKRRKKIISIIFLVVTFLAFLAFGYLFYKGYIFSKELGFRLDPKSLISFEKHELKKDSSGEYTNVLLMGIDTRESETLLNTDTLILVSYNHKSNNILMISIPRDFHVEVDENTKWYVRINSIYSSAEQKKEGSGIEALKDTVTRVTGQEIQYYAMVDFKAFEGLIDAVGGVDVNVENSFTDYSYPEGYGYKTVSFKAGPQTMDGATALIYSRSRHSQQNNEGTDFARAKRQQKVIIALKEKILSTESLSNPKTLMGILSSVSGNVKVSEFSLNDIDAAFDLAKKYDEGNGKTYSFVLDPESGNSSLIERKYPESGAYAIGPKLGYGKYSDIITYVGLLKKYPDIYSWNPKIVVYDTGLGYKLARERFVKLSEMLPYMNLSFGGTLYKDKEGEYIYSNDAEMDSLTNNLKDLFEIKNMEKPEYMTINNNGTDVTILIGKEIISE